MDPRHLDELIARERTYWWHVAKRQLVLEILKRRFPPPGVLVEGGVGGGANLLACRDLGYDVTGFDRMPESVEHCRRRGIPRTEVLDLQDEWPIPGGSVDAILLLDVIEHLPDPIAALKHAAATLKPHGGIVVTVPAIPLLMGPWDRILGHYRRYSRSMFQEHARKAGLRTVWLSYWNSFTLPPALVLRSLERVFPRREKAEFPAVSAVMNSALIGCAAMERAAMFTIGIPIGLSLVGVLQR